MGEGGVGIQGEGGGGVGIQGEGGGEGSCDRTELGLALLFEAWSEVEGGASEGPL